ncbi:MAG: hypothetical protein U9M92_00575 [Patescibacteria group bacterium]|nr:hypothetical protein [Patescibacteria group bacterium]
MAGLVALALFTSTNGCGGALKNFEPDRISVGVGAREAKANFSVLDIDIVLPTIIVRIKKHLSEWLDVYVQAQVCQGGLHAQRSVLRARAEGYFAGVGWGLDWYLFGTRLLGLQVGGEIFWADYDIRGGWGPFQLRIDDRLYGSGLNVGLVGEVPLGKSGRWWLTWGACRNFTNIAPPRYPGRP